LPAAASAATYYYDGPSDSRCWNDPFYCDDRYDSSWNNDYRYDNWSYDNRYDSRVYDNRYTYDNRYDRWNDDAWYGDTRMNHWNNDDLWRNDDYRYDWNQPYRTSNTRSYRYTASTTYRPPVYGGATVEIGRYGFGPNVITVRQGETVTWINRDGRQHAVRSETPGLFASASFGSGQRYSVTFLYCGTFTYVDPFTGATGEVRVSR
jgi:plastocyanin